MSEQEQRLFQRSRVWAADPGKYWHENYIEQLSAEQYFRSRKHLVSALVSFLEVHPEYRKCCEVGTGNGRFLLHIAEVAPTLESLVGIDLNVAQIEKNENKYLAQKPRVSFMAGELASWVAKNTSKDPVVFIFVGTLVYFTQSELETTLQLLAKSFPGCAIGICDTVNDDMVIESCFKSKPRGSMMFSHNYPHVLKKAGFEINAMHTVLNERKPQKDYVLFASKS